MLHKKMVSVYVLEDVVKAIDEKRGNFTRSSYVGSLLLKYLYKKDSKKLKKTIKYQKYLKNYRYTDK